MHYPTSIKSESFSGMTWNRSLWNCSLSFLGVPSVCCCIIGKSYHHILHLLWISATSHVIEVAVELLSGSQCLSAPTTHYHSIWCRDSLSWSSLSRKSTASSSQHPWPLSPTHPPFPPGYSHLSAAAAAQDSWRGTRCTAGRRSPGSASFTGTGTQYRATFTLISLYWALTSGWTQRPLVQSGCRAPWWCPWAPSWWPCRTSPRSPSWGTS